MKVKFPNRSSISIWNSLKHKIPLGQCVNACLDVLYHTCSIRTADARMLNIPDVRYTPTCSDMHFGPRPNIRKPDFFLSKPDIVTCNECMICYTQSLAHILPPFMCLYHNLRFLWFYRSPAHQFSLISAHLQVDRKWYYMGTKLAQANTSRKKYIPSLEVKVKSKSIFEKKLK